MPAQQRVCLVGGTHDGLITEAQMPPAPLRMRTGHPVPEWLELYLYAPGETSRYDGADLPLMRYQATTDAMS